MHIQVHCSSFYCYLLRNKQCHIETHYALYDVTSCVICISNEVEYLEKEGSYKNSTKEVTLSFLMIFPMQ